MYDIKPGRRPSKPILRWGDIVDTDLEVYVKILQIRKHSVFVLELMCCAPGLWKIWHLIEPKTLDGKI